MAEVAFCPEPDHVVEMLENCPRTSDEIAETRMGRSCKSPYDPERNEPGDNVAGVDMQPTRLAFRDVTDCECSHDDPVKRPYEEIPDFQFFFRLHLILSFLRPMDHPEGFYLTHLAIEIAEP